jgi:hypothetical protein
MRFPGSGFEWPSSSSSPCSQQSREPWRTRRSRRQKSDFLLKVPIARRHGALNPMQPAHICGTRANMAQSRSELLDHISMKSQLEADPDISEDAKLNARVARAANHKRPFRRGGQAKLIVTSAIARASHRPARARIARVPASLAVPRYEGLSLSAGRMQKSVCQKEQITGFLLLLSHVGVSGWRCERVTALKGPQWRSSSASRYCWVWRAGPSRTIPR